MKYKIGDRVYYTGEKYKVANVFTWGVRIEKGKARFWVTPYSIKPIVRCSNDH